MRTPRPSYRLLFGFILLWPLAARAEDDNVSVSFDTVARAEVEHRLRTGEVDNNDRELVLRGLFEASGCTGEKLAEQPVKHAKSPNLICTLDGQSDKTIVVGGHFDFVAAGKGLVDNWSGSSLLPSLFESLKGTARHHTFRFIGFADEEKGLVGSRYYVRTLSKGDVKSIRAMINLDSLGADSTKMELDRGDKQLVDALSSVSENLHLPLSAVNVHDVGRSDSDSFQDRDVPSINIHSLTARNFSILHSKKDTFDAIQMNQYYDSYLLIRAYLAYLDETLDRPRVADTDR